MIDLEGSADPIGRQGDGLRITRRIGDRQTNQDSPFGSRLGIPQVGVTGQILCEQLPALLGSAFEMERVDQLVVVDIRASPRNRPPL